MKMQKHEVLRHIADNMEAGKPEFEGLVLTPIAQQAPVIGSPVKPMPPIYEMNLNNLFVFTEFSLAPVMIVVNGVEVEGGYEGDIPANGLFFVPDANSIDYYTSYRWSNSALVKALKNRKRVYLDADKAAARGKLEASGTPF